MHPLDPIHYCRLRPRDQNKPASRAYFLALSLCLLPVLTACLVLWALRHAWYPSAQPGATTCGSSPSEATSRGCRFDILSFAWQTPECYDQELMEDFMRYDDWKFYEHPNSTAAVVNLTTALEGQRTLYVDWKFHVTHCTFAWRQLHRGYALRGYVDSHLDNHRHTLHCQRTLLDRQVPMDSVTVVAALKYPKCRKITVETVRGRRLGELRAFAANGHVYRQ